MFKRTIKNIYLRLIKVFCKICERIIYFNLKHKIKKIPTIISRDCCGGVIYKKLNLEFLSPTINLNIKKEDFICFCTHLKSFLNAELIEYANTEYSYPLGIISTDYGSVILHFFHYKSFKEAVDAWERRKKRVNYDNIFILLNAGPNVDEKYVQDFLSLPFEHKAILSSGMKEHKFCYNLKCYENGFPGPLVKYCGKFTTKRYLDEYNWKEIFF